MANQITATAEGRLLHVRRSRNADGVQCLVIQDDSGGAARWVAITDAEAARLLALAPQLRALELDDVRNDACDSVAARDAAATAPKPAETDAEQAAAAAFTTPAPATPAPEPPAASEAAADAAFNEQPRG